MSDFIASLSSYNLLNYLLAGVVFSALASWLTGRPLESDNALVAVFVYYFIGLVISRFGSVIIEPVLKRAKIIEFADYSDFVEASKVDGKIDVLSEQNNVYRTLVSTVTVLLLLGLWSRLTQAVPSLVDWGRWLLMVALLALFVLSYRKQSEYIVKRVKANSR